MPKEKHPISTAFTGITGRNHPMAHYAGWYSGRHSVELPNPYWLDDNLWQAFEAGFEAGKKHRASLEKRS